MNMMPSQRDQLIKDIEEQCPTILQPSETSKMRALKALCNAREALDKYADRSRMLLHLREGREMYDRVSRDLDIKDIRRMTQDFVALEEHLSALQVLLKRFSDIKTPIDAEEALELKGLITGDGGRDGAGIGGRASGWLKWHRGGASTRKPDRGARHPNPGPWIPTIALAMVTGIATATAT